MIEVNELCFSRFDGGQRQQVLNHLSFSLGTGEQLALLGDSGSGKTTLLHLLAGLLTPEQGEIHIKGQAIHLFDDQQAALYRRRIGLIFQHYQLLDCLNVKQNILFQHKLNSDQVDTNEFNHLVEELGLTNKLNALPEQLSGGEQQRVGIARAMLNQPQLVLADEPTGNLDSTRSHQVVKLLTDMCKQRKINLVMVTHSQQLTQYFDQTKVLKDGKFAART